MGLVPSARIPANTVDARLQKCRSVSPMRCRGRRRGFFCLFNTMKIGSRTPQLAVLPTVISTAIGAAIAASAFPALAQNQLKDTVVTASRLEQRSRDALQANLLLTREDIERSQAIDLPGLLKGATGIEWAQTGGSGTLATAFIRGAESRHTLVLVDGVPVNNLNFNTAALEHIPLSNIERIEVVRGNASALYGSSALGGVIQIFTREATDVPYGGITVQAGSRGFGQIQAGAGVKLGTGTRLSFTAEALKDGSFNAIDQAKRPGTNPDDDAYARRSWSFGVSQDIGIGKIGLSARESTGQTAYDSQFGPATQADESRFHLQGAALTGQFKLGSAVSLDVALTTQADRLNADITAFPYFVNSKGEGASAGLRWQLAPGQNLTAGIESTRQSIESDTVYNTASRTQDSARLGYLGEFDRHQVQLNLRQDKYSDFGSASTWLAGYGFRLSDTWRISAQASTGFNAPTFNDLYFPFGGNANLRPEKVESAEIALQYATATQEVRLVLFDNRFKDLIGLDAFFNSVNVNEARNNGAEISYRGKFGDTSVTGGFTAQNPMDLTTNTRLNRRAQTLANLGVEHVVGAWGLGAKLRSAGERLDGANKLEAYTVADISVAYKWSPAVKLFGRIDNLLDAKYETIYGYNTGGTKVFAGVSWQPVR
jgi:vitamin B12 transporter